MDNIDEMTDLIDWIQATASVSEWTKDKERYAKAKITKLIVDELEHFDKEVGRVGHHNIRVVIKERIKELQKGSKE